MNILQRKPKRVMKKTIGVAALGLLTGVSLLVAGALLGQMILVGAGSALLLFTLGIAISCRGQAPVSYV